MAEFFQTCRSQTAWRTTSLPQKLPFRIRNQYLTFSPNKNGDPKAAILISSYLGFELIEIGALNFSTSIATIMKT